MKYEESYKSRLMSEHKESGLSISAYCRKKGIEPKVMYGWYRMRGGVPKTSGSFALVSGTPEITLELLNGSKLKFAVSALSHVLKELDIK